MLRRCVLMLTLGAATTVVSGCGAKEAEVVKGAFEKDISSATISMTLNAQSSQGGTKVALQGPYKSNGEGKLPSADLAVKIEGAAPRPLEGRLISSGTNAFVEYGGETYEIGEKTVAEMQRSGSADQPTPEDVKSLMGQMQDWFPESDTQEEADLDGEPVTRVTGQLDISAALKDLKSLAERQGLSSAEGLKDLSNGDIKRIERMFSDPKFTVDVGRDDGKLRRIVATMKMDTGADAGTMEFELRFKDVDKPVQIDAPATGSGKPIEELGRRLEEEFGGGGGATTPADEQIS